MGRFVFSLIIIFFSLNQGVVWGQDSQKFTPADNSPEEIIRYTKEAVALVEAKGEGAYAELTDPDGPWVDGDWYLYINNFNGEIVAHLNKKLVGRNMFGVRDSKGNGFYAQLQENARSERGYGWTEFWWPKPDSTVPSQKLGFVMRVPSKYLWVGTGSYDMRQEDIDRILSERNGN